MEFMAGESHYWPRRQCYRSACKLCVCVCVSVCVCTYGAGWQLQTVRGMLVLLLCIIHYSLSLPKSNRDKEKICESPSHRFAHQPKSLAPLPPQKRWYMGHMSS